MNSKINVKTAAPLYRVRKLYCTVKWVSVFPVIQFRFSFFRAEDYLENWHGWGTLSSQTSELMAHDNLSRSCLLIIVCFYDPSLWYRTVSCARLRSFSFSIERESHEEEKLLKVFFSRRRKTKTNFSNIHSVECESDKRALSAAMSWLNGKKGLQRGLNKNAK